MSMARNETMYQPMFFNDQTFRRIRNSRMCTSKYKIRQNSAHKSVLGGNKSLAMGTVVLVDDDDGGDGDGDGSCSGDTMAANNELMHL